jgi:hypothetical protein
VPVMSGVWGGGVRALTHPSIMSHSLESHPKSHRAERVAFVLDDVE